MSTVRRRFILALVVLAAAPLLWFIISAPPRVLRPAQSIIDKAESLEVFRLAPEDLRIGFPPQQAEPKEGFFETYPLKATIASSELGSGYKERAAAAIKAAIKRDPNEVTVCILKPGVAFRFTRGKQTATIFLCYYCGDGFVLVRDANGMSTYTRKYGFVRSNEALLGVIKEAFPNDADIAKLVAAKGELPESHN